MDIEKIIKELIEQLSDPSIVQVELDWKEVGNENVPHPVIRIWKKGENDISDYDKELTKRRNAKSFTEEDMQSFAYYAHPLIMKVTLDVLFEDWKDIKGL